MLSRLPQSLRTAARGLATSTRATKPRSRHTWALGGTLLIGLTAAIAIRPDVYSSRFVIHADSAASDLRGVKSQDAFRQDPDTSIMHPVILPLTTTTTPLTLVGLGVRTVSFLSVRVYSAAFYLEQRLVGHLDSIAGFSTYTADHLHNPPKPSSDPLGAPQLSGEALIRNLLDTGVTCAVRIVPVRNTDFGHLRDGFTRAVVARQKLAKKKDELTEADEARIADSLQTLKSLFPTQSAPKGKALVLVRRPAGLTVEYEGKVLGEVNDPWVARELMIAYFADKDVISPKLKSDVATGLLAFVKH